MATFNKKGEIEEGKVYFQLKATDRLKLTAQQETFPFRVSRFDLVFWLAQPLPVILVVFDAKKEVAYWLYVQSYFSREPGFNLFTAGKTITVQVPIANVVNVSAVRKFAGFRDRLVAQMGDLKHEED